MSPKRTPAGPFEPKALPINPPKRRKRQPLMPPPRQAPIEQRVQQAAVPPPRGNKATTEGHSPAKPEIMEKDPLKKNTALYRYLRYCAGMQFVTDQTGCTVAQLHSIPMFRAVKLDTLGQWCAEDRWVARRQITMEQWKATIENKIGSELVRARQMGMEKMKFIFDKVYHKIEADTVQPKSLEGLVTALVKLAEIMDSWNDKIAQTIIPDVPILSSGGPVESAKPKLTQVEAREAAKLIMTSRRAEMRAESAKQTAEIKAAQEAADDGR